MHFNDLHILPQLRDEDLALGIRVASGAVGVIRRIDSPAAIVDALAAVSGGDLAPAVLHGEEEGEAPPPPSPDALLPLYPPGAGQLPPACAAGSATLHVDSCRTMHPLALHTESC